MPKLLTAPQRHDRIQCSTENLLLCQQSPTKFLPSIVTGDESWVHHYDPLSQQEAKVWTKKGETPSARPRQQRSAGKVLLSVFWDEKGVLLTDYLKMGHTVTGVYYAGLIEKLREAIKNKRRGKLSAGVHMLHDNAPSHASHVAVTAIHAAGFKTLNHPPYSPDLAPSDFHLFSHLKRHLRGRVFESDDEVIHSVESYFASQPLSFYSDAIAALPGRWQRAIDTRGSYIE
jgi:histone-lysine N-methyltransferase SETMAR